ncbi:MAG: hypothetical protein ACOX3V_04270 [Bacillota bacterium]
MNIDAEMNDDNQGFMRFLRLPWWTMFLGGALLATAVWFGARMCGRGSEIEVIATEE